jgi:hypothetical protein
MERGVLVGGLLISASFLLAVTLNQAAKEASRRDLHHAPAPRLEAPVRDLPVEAGAPTTKPCATVETPARKDQSVSPSTNCDVGAPKPE